MDVRFLAKVLLATGLLLISACTGVASPPQEASLPRRPAVPTGALDPVTEDALEHLSWLVGRPRLDDIPRIAESYDVRAAWPLVDLLRFAQDTPEGERAEAALASLTAVGQVEYRDAAEVLGVDPARPWVVFSELLLAWDIPPPPDYVRFKKGQHRAFDPALGVFFDPEADIDWRLVSWGGVPRDGIPDLRDPEVSAADAADHLEGDDIVFGIELAGTARAYPRRIMRVHEVVNDRVGGVPVVLSLCTLCGVATAYRAACTGQRQTS